MPDLSARCAVSRLFHTFSHGIVSAKQGIKFETGADIGDYFVFPIGHKSGRVLDACLEIEHHLSPNSVNDIFVYVDD
jgi:hypothetical protein